MVAAGTWRHLREVAAFADDLAARGRALPAVVAPPVTPLGVRGLGRPGGVAPTGHWRGRRLGAVARARPAARRAGRGRAAVPGPASSAASSQRPSTRSRRGCAAQAVGVRSGVDRSRRADAPDLAGRARGPATGTSTPARAPSRLWPPNWRTGSGRWSAGPRGRGSAWSSPAPRSSPPPRSTRPRAPEQLWTLEFALQATAEPSLVAPAEQVWAGSGTAQALARLVPSPRAALLTELGRASRLYPELERALRAARPEALVLDTPSAHDFLREAAPVLAAAGFGVDLPGWWSRPSARLGARLRARGRGQPGVVAGRPGVGQEALVDYEWEVSLGEERLDAEELARLAELQQPLVRLRGQWVELDPRRLARGLKLLAQPPSPALSLAEVLGLAATLDEDTAGLPVLGVEGEGWVGDLLSAAADDRLEQVAGARGVHRHAAALPGARAGVAGVPRPGRARRRPRRRHGPRQDRPGARPGRPGRRRLRDLCPESRRRRASSSDYGTEDARGRARADAAGVPHVAGRQLAARGRAVHAATCVCTSITARTARAARSSTRPSRPPTSCSPPTPSPRATSRRCGRCPGAGSSSTRRRRSRTRRPGRRRPCGRWPPGSGSPSPGRRSRTGSPTSGRLLDTCNPGLLGRPPRSPAASPSRSSGSATRRPRTGCAP